MSTPTPPADGSTSANAALGQLPQLLADGNLVAVKQQMDAGQLSGLREYLTGEQMTDFENAVNNGDIDAARAAVAGVVVPGVGELSPKKRSPWLIAGIAAAVVLVLALVAALLIGDDEVQNIPDTLAADSDFSTFSELVEAAGFTDLLAETGPYTVFAPTDDAFDQITDEEMVVLRSDDAKLQALVGYHVVVGQEIAEEDLSGETNSMQGSPLVFSDSGDDTKVNDATIVRPDIEATNGVIHGIDAVLIPPGLDLTAPPGDDIMGVLAGDARFSTLTSLLTSSGLSQTLSSAGPFTVFAPTDDAFADLPAEQTEALQNDAALLRQVLSYHVVAGEYTSSSLETGQLTSVEGSPLDIVVSGSSITVNGANVIAADLMASNGVVHGIDQVLVPPGADLNPTTTTEAPTTTEAVTTTDAPTTLAPTTTAPASG